MQCMRITLNKTKGTQDPRPQDPILSPVQIFNKCSNVQIFKCSNVQMFKCSCVNFPLAGRPHRSRRLSRLAARSQRCTRRLTRIACNVLLPMANRILLSPCKTPRTLHPSCVASGQQNLALTLLRETYPLHPSCVARGRLLPMANRICETPCTLLPSCVANGQRLPMDSLMDQNPCRKA